MLAGVVCERGCSPEGIRDGLDQVAAVGKRETLARRVRKRGQEVAGVAGGDLITIGVLSVSQFAITGEDANQAMRLGERKGAA